MRRLAARGFIYGSGLQPRRNSAVPSYKDLKYPPLRQVKVPEPTQFTLSNGMRVFLLEDHELPLVRGSATDPHRQSVRSAGQERVCRS